MPYRYMYVALFLLHDGNVNTAVNIRKVMINTSSVQPNFQKYT